MEDVHYSERALELGPMTFERWAALGGLLGRIHGSVGFWVGDWILYGERAYGERYAQGVETCGLSPDTLRGYAWVAERLAPVRRRTGLSWSAHREVAGLAPADADALLDRAEREGLASRDLRRLVQERRALEAGEEPTVTVTVRARRADVDRWQQASGLRPLEEVVVELLNGWANDAA